MYNSGKIRKMALPCCADCFAIALSREIFLVIEAEYQGVISYIIKQVEVVKNEKLFFYIRKCNRRTSR